MFLFAKAAAAASAVSEAASEVVSEAATTGVASSAEEVVETTVENVVTVWDNIWHWLSTNWPSFLFCAIILVGGWWAVTLLVRLMKQGMKKAGIETSAITFITSVTKYLLRFVVIIFCLYPFGMQFSSVFAALGAAGIGLGLGLKEFVSNVASGITIIVTKPFSSGDYISIGDVEGTVERVEIMHTTIKTVDSSRVIIPNSTLTAGTVTNFTILGVRRISYNFNLQYGTNLQEIRETVLAIAKANDMVLEEPAPMFVVLGQEADGIACSLRVYVHPENYWLVFWAINESISDTFREKDIRVPFSQLDVHICNPTGDSGGDPEKTAHFD
ncbi:MAG: mechanosensitive ion channel [Oscillospiraceae bacterium]|nr:mechanosensitive ion channel [Oscillospiraceae bacterium]